MFNLNLNRKNIFWYSMIFAGFMGSAVAGQTKVEYHDDNPYRSMPMPAPRYALDDPLNIGGKGLHYLLNNEAIYLEQTVESKGYFLYRPTASMSANIPKDQIMNMTTASGNFGTISAKPGSCNFSGTTTYCPLTLQADSKVRPGAGTGVSLSARAAAHNYQSWSSVYKPITILEHVESGNINMAAPDGSDQQISLIAASDDNIVTGKNTDAMPVTIKLLNAVNVKTSHLTFTANKSSYDVAFLDRYSCDLSSDNDYTCKVFVSPLRKGNTSYQVGGTWTSNTGKTGAYNPSKFDVSVGALYAGYQSDKIHRKGATFSLSGGMYGVSALAVNQFKGQLYALDGYNLYNLDLSSQTATPSKFTEINNAIGQTLSLTNNSSVITFGDDLGTQHFYDVTSHSETNLLRPVANAPLTFASVDTSRDVVYAANGNGSVYKMYVDPVTHQGQIKDTYFFQDYENLQVIGTKDGAFIIGSKINGDYSDVFSWNGEAGVAPIKLTTTDNPFIHGNIIVAAYAPTDQFDFFSQGMDGKLYKLAAVPGQTNMKWTAYNAGKPILGNILDATVDANQNVYLAGGGTYEVWMLPYDGTEGHKIQGFNLGGDDVIDSVVLDLPREPSTSTSMSTVGTVAVSKTHYGYRYDFNDYSHLIIKDYNFSSLNHITCDSDGYDMVVADNFSRCDKDGVSCSIPLAGASLISTQSYPSSSLICTLWFNNYSSTASASFPVVYN